MFEKWWLFADVWGARMLHDAWIFIAWFAWFPLILAETPPIPNAQVRAIVKTLMRSPFVATSMMLLLVSLVMSSYIFPRTSKVCFESRVSHHTFDFYDQFAISRAAWKHDANWQYSSCPCWDQQRPPVLRKWWSESEIKLQWLICTLLQCGGEQQCIKLYCISWFLTVFIFIIYYTLLRCGLGDRSSHIDMIYISRIMHLQLHVRWKRFSCFLVARKWNFYKATNRYYKQTMALTWSMPQVEHRTSCFLGKALSCMCRNSN